MESVIDNLKGQGVHGANDTPLTNYSDLMELCEEAALPPPVVISEPLIGLANNSNVEIVVEDAAPLQLAPEQDPALLAQHYYQDHDAYKLEFFPKTVRQASPTFHTTIESQLWSGRRYNGFEIFRDGAKTTLLRLFTSKRIAYGISRTIVYVSNSAENAERSIDWIKKQVTTNHKWASFYGLKPSDTKWASKEIEIVHTLLDIRIRVIAVGIQGQHRGINIEDYRPDLIIVDDADDEGTTNTPEQCKKYNKIFFGSIVRSLAPSSENPHAMIAVLQTPLAEGDIINTCKKDPAWNVLSISCFDENKESVWPARYSTAYLLEEKASAIAKRLLSVWLREMEMVITGDEGAAFDSNWLKFYDTLPPYFDNICIAIDPASSVAKSADDNAIAMWGKAGGNYYLIAFTAERGQSHIETSQILIEDFMPLGRKLLNGRNPIVAVETIGYQKNLKVQIEVDQRKYGKFFAVTPINDRRAKFDRIEQAFHGNSFAGNIHCAPNHYKFIEQFSTYSKDSKLHDDLLDASAMAVTQLDPYGTGYTEIARGGVRRQFTGLRLPRNARRTFSSGVQYNE